MKSLFNSSDNNDIVERINKLKPDTKPVWGKMRVEQMLAHSQAPLMVAFGEHKLKRGLMGILFGKMVKKKLLADAPFKRNLPTSPSFIIKDDRKFEEEKNKLIRLVRRFETGGPESLTKDPHPFFGKLSSVEWDSLQYKHLDHHLTQFGV